MNKKTSTSFISSDLWPPTALTLVSSPALFAVSCSSESIEHERYLGILGTQQATGSSLEQIIVDTDSNECRKNLVPVFTQKADILTITVIS